jgi:hypothetical protein
MDSNALRTAWYHFAVAFRRSVSSYLTLALLIGSIGGIAMASTRDENFGPYSRKTLTPYPIPRFQFWRSQQ